MKKTFFILLGAIFLYFCSSNTTGPTDENKITGEWQWVVSSGGFAGKTITPASAGFDISYTFFADSTVIFARNDTTIFSSKFEIVDDTLKINANSIDQIIEIENDRLTMTENCIDCFEHVYERKTNLSNNIIMIDDFTLIDLIGDPLQINSVSIFGDNLTISVSYSGGCKEHDFGLFAGRAFMESNPVQAQLIFAHNAHGDECEAWITKTLNFNLSPLKDVYKNNYGSGKGSIYLRIATASDSTIYKPMPLYSFN